MRLIIMSDSHLSWHKIETVMKRHIEDADMFIHLGDGLRDFFHVIKLLEMKGVSVSSICHAVKGNCDSPDTEIPKAVTHDLPFGYRLTAVHGHEQSVKHGLMRLRNLARKTDSDIMVYGHTHQAYECYEPGEGEEKGKYYLNPGSLGEPRNPIYPTYGYVDITEAGVVTGILRV